MRQMQELEQGRQNQNHSWNFGMNWLKECCSTTWMMKEGQLLKLSDQRLGTQWRNCQMSIGTRRGHFSLANGMTKKVPGEWQKINTKGHSVQHIDAKKGAKHIVHVTKGCQYAWNATKSMRSIWELQRNRSQISL